jgi:hypothetical protein
MAPAAVVARAAELLQARAGDRVVIEFAPPAEPLSFFVTNRATPGGAVRSRVLFVAKADGEGTALSARIDESFDVRPKAPSAAPWLLMGVMLLAASPWLGLFTVTVGAPILIGSLFMVAGQSEQPEPLAGPRAREIMATVAHVFAPVRRTGHPYREGEQEPPDPRETPLPEEQGESAEKVAVLEVAAAPSAVVKQAAAMFGGEKVAGFRFRDHFDPCRCYVERKRKGMRATRVLVVASAHHGGARVEIHRPNAARSPVYVLVMSTWMTVVLAMGFGPIMFHFLGPMLLLFLGASQLGRERAERAIARDHAEIVEAMTQALAGGEREEASVSG